MCEANHQQVIEGIKYVNRSNKVKMITNVCYNISRSIWSDNLILKLFYVCLKITHRVDIEKIIKQAESYSVDIADKTVGVHLKQIIIHLLSIVHSFYSKTDIK